MARVFYVNQDECSGCETCFSDLPEVFEITDEGLARVHDPKGADEDRIQEVMDMCPSECILWKD
jgi:ferredoxin